MTQEFDVLSISENDSNFDHEFEDLVNGRMSSADKTAWVMACSHRYLQTQIFRVALAYIGQMAVKWHTHRYDDRNEYPAKMPAFIYDHLLESGQHYDCGYEELIKRGN